MNDQLIPFGPGAKLFIGLYLLSLLVVGAFGYRARKKDSLRDFYLAGRGIGFVVLLLTLYSTQYSGNTMMGFTGKAYRVGFSWATCIHFMTAIVVVYLFFAPSLYARAKANGYITPTDYLTDRFRLPALSLIASILMCVSISNYLLAQLMAMGRVLEGLAPNDPASKSTAYVTGICVLALIIVIYETLGGFRAVAWTDAIQGSVLIVGFFILLAMVLSQFGSIAHATATLSRTAPEKIALPSPAVCRNWASYIVLVGLGGALYPQSIQRIYAARSAKTLRRTLIVMAFLPLTTTLIAVITGVIAAATIPGLTAAKSDTVLFVLCRQVQQQSMFGYCLVVVLFSAVLAAIMSTADSVLLSISSMITKDIYAVHIRPSASEGELTKFGKICSWVLILILSLIAIDSRDTTLVQLLDQKFNLLAQLSPAFILGIRWKQLPGKPVMFGMIAGVLVSLAIAGTIEYLKVVSDELPSCIQVGKLFGVHAGIYGLAVNLIVVLVGSSVAREEG